MATTNFLRYEEKYLITKEQFLQLKPHLLEHMEYDSYCRGDVCYSIYNIYYDDDYNSVIINSLSKPYYKEKLRMRSYKEITKDDDLVFLEMKKKINGIVSKRRIVLKYGEVQKLLNNQDIDVPQDEMQKYNEFKYFLEHHHLKPKVYLRYDRIAFFGKDDHNFRITFDYNIIARRDNVNFQTPTTGESILDQEKMIMEIKITKSLPLWLVELLSQNKIYPTSFSKYGNEYKNYCRGEEKK